MIEEGWFATLSHEVKDLLMDNAECQTVSEGQFVYRRGDAPTAFYGVVEGYLKIANQYPDGREALLSIVGTGSWFGEQSLIENRPRLHDVQALCPSKILTVPRQRFEDMMLQAPFSAALSRLLATRLRWLYCVLEDASWHTPRVRLARRLLLLTRGDAVLSSRCNPSITLPQQSLALMLGISRQTLSKELHAMANDGALVMRYGRIEIGSLEVLERLAGSPD